MSAAADGVPDKIKAGSLEMVPWGISAVQANESAVVAAAKKVLNNVLYCVIDTGRCSSCLLRASLLTGASACGRSC